MARTKHQIDIDRLKWENDGLAARVRGLERIAEEHGTLKKKYDEQSVELFKTTTELNLLKNLIVRIFEVKRG